MVYIHVSILYVWYFPLCSTRESHQVTSGHPMCSRPAAQSRSSGGLPSKSPDTNNQMEYNIRYVYIYIYMYHLVGGFNNPEKCWSTGMIIPNICENQKCSKPPTRYIYIYKHVSLCFKQQPYLYRKCLCCKHFIWIYDMWLDDAGFTQIQYTVHECTFYICIHHPLVI